MRYKIPLVFAYEKDGIFGHKEGYQIICADNKKNATIEAKKRTLESLKLQNARAIFIDIKEPKLYKIK